MVLDETWASVLVKILKALLTFLACVTSVACTATVERQEDTGCAQHLTSGPVVEHIRALEVAGAASNVKGFTREGLERLSWPGYVSVGPDGVVMTRDAIFADFKEVPWASTFDVRELDIQVRCDMAVAVGRSEALWIGAPANTRPINFRWLNVWTQSGGEWRLSATQFTRFSKEKKVEGPR
jgi:hypothetical protein